ncbi:unnamed protein product [Arctogadus glacialis]
MTEFSLTGLKTQAGRREEEVEGEEEGEEEEEAEGEEVKTYDKFESKVKVLPSEYSRCQVNPVIELNGLKPRKSWQSSGIIHQHWDGSSSKRRNVSMTSSPPPARNLSAQHQRPPPHQDLLDIVGAGEGDLFCTIVAVILWQAQYCCQRNYRACRELYGLQG